MKTLALASLTFLAASGLAAQSVHDGAGHWCTLRVVDGVALSSTPLSPGELAAADAAARRSGVARTVVTEGAAATFEVRYVGFTEEAEAAFQSAVDIWADHLVSTVPVRVEANFGPLGERVLGSAGPRITANFGAGQPETWYAFALADALAGQDLFPGTSVVQRNPDLEATFNSEFDDFYFGTDGNTPAGQFDFRSIVLHELGHGLGFVGSAEYDDGIVSDESGVECDGVEGHGCWGISTADGSFFAPLIFDRLVEDASGVAMTDETAFPLNSQALGDLVTSNGLTTSIANKDIFLDGIAIREVNEGAPAPIYAPRPAEPGSSFSHWDEFVFRPTVGSNALMSPSIGPGEAYADPGALTCALFQDLGWTLAPACEALFPVSDDAGPEAVAATLTPIGANPFRTSTAFRLVGPEAASVSVLLVDALGRTVASLYDGPLGPTGVRLGVDGRDLAPGVYSVRVLGLGAPLSASVVRA